MKPSMKLTLRDFFWLTTLVAVSVGWLLDRHYFACGYVEVSAKYETVKKLVFKEGIFVDDRSLTGPVVLHKFKVIQPPPEMPKPQKLVVENPPSYDGP